MIQHHYNEKSGTLDKRDISGGQKQNEITQNTRTASAGSGKNKITVFV